MLLESESMGEIRVAVTLTNAIDEGIARRGDLPIGEIRRVTTDAVVDTGAVRSCIPHELASQLGVALVNEFTVELANGQAEQVWTTEPIRFDVEGRTTTEPALVLGNEVLIGQTILETTDLVADCAGKRLFPNPLHPDGPVLKVKLLKGGE